MFNYLPLEEKNNLLHSISNVIASVRLLFFCGIVKMSITRLQTYDEELIYLCFIIQENILYCVCKGDKISQNIRNCFAVLLLQNGTIHVFLILDIPEVVTKKSTFAACTLFS